MFGFGGKKVAETTVKECTRIVEAWMTKVGIDAQKNRLQGDTPGWVLMRGSASVYILLNEDKNGSSIRIISPVLYLPQENLVAFYRRLLELNSTLRECAFAVAKDTVILVFERGTVDLSAAELENNVQWLSYVADTLDDTLAKEFGCKLYLEGQK